METIIRYILQLLFMLTSGYLSMRLHNTLLNKPIHDRAVNKTVVYTLLIFWLLSATASVLSKVLLTGKDFSVFNDVFFQATVWVVIHSLLSIVLLPCLITAFLPDGYFRRLEKNLCRSFVWCIPILAIPVMWVLIDALTRISTGLRGALDILLLTDRFTLYGAFVLIIIFGIPLVKVFFSNEDKAEQTTKIEESKTRCATAIYRLGQALRKQYGASAVDARRSVTRFFIACLAVFMPVFTLLIFGPLDVFFGNISIFEFIFSDFAPLMIIAAIVITLFVAFFISLLHNRAFDVVIAFLLGIGICIYLQGTFLNPNLGPLNGSSIDWSAYSGYTIVNIIIWLAIISGTIVLCIKANRIWGKIMTAIPLFVISVQMVALVFSLVNAPKSAFVFSNKAQYVIDGSEQFTVSDHDNTVVFILDHFSNSYLDEIVKEYPDALEFLKDFTCYTNMDTGYSGTFPSITHMLTDLPFDPTISWKQWVENAWKGEAADMYYELLNEQHYGVFAYTSEMHGIPNTYLAAGKLQNVVMANSTSYTVRESRMLRQLAFVSLYRYAPFIAKPLFWIDTEMDIVQIQYDDIIEPIHENPAFYDQLISSGLKVVSGQNRLIYQHLDGTHPSYATDENCHESYGVSLAQCGKGCLVLVEEYLNQLKELDLYDDATVIITADHGDHNKNPQPVFFIKRAGKVKNQLDYNNAPISENDLVATILDCANVKDSYPYGTSIFDMPTNLERERVFSVYAYDENCRNATSIAQLAVYNAFYNYRYTGDKNDLLSVIEDVPTEVVPMIDSHY